MIERKDINESRELNIYKLDGCSVDDAIEYLTEFRKKTNSSARLGFEIHETYGDVYIQLDAYWVRPETDEEYKARKVKSVKASEAAKRSAKKRKAQKEQDERALLLTLKQKYEP